MKGTGQTSLNGIVGKTINHHYCTITTWAAFFVINSLLFTIDLRNSNAHCRKIIFNIRYILRSHIAIAIWALHILVLYSRCQTIFLTTTESAVACTLCILGVLSLDVWYPGRVESCLNCNVLNLDANNLNFLWMYCVAFYSRRRSQPSLTTY
jgi:hypothetical protein